MAVNETGVVEIVESVKDWVEHLARFVGGERALGDDLGKKLLGEVADDVDALAAVDLGTAKVVDADQVRAGKLCGLLPAGEAFFGLRGGREEPEGCFLGTQAVELGEEGAAGAGPAEPLEEGVSPVDDLADPVAANRNSIHGLSSVVEEAGSREQRAETREQRSEIGGTGLCSVAGG